MNVWVVTKNFFWNWRDFWNYDMAWLNSHSFPAKRRNIRAVNTDGSTGVFHVDGTILERVVPNKFGEVVVTTSSQEGIDLSG